MDRTSSKVKLLIAWIGASGSISTPAIGGVPHGTPVNETVVLRTVRFTADSIEIPCRYCVVCGVTVAKRE
jgi:hypothetical protein